MLFVLSVSMLTPAINVEAEVFETIYIEADGSIVPSTAPISRVGDLYTLTDDILGEIVVERDNIVIDGASYTIQGTDFNDQNGIEMVDRANITASNLKLTNLDFGIYLRRTINSTFHNITISNSYFGFAVYNSNYSAFIDNNLTACSGGFYLGKSNSSVIINNEITNQTFGIQMDYSQNNLFINNNVSSNLFFGFIIRHSTNNTFSNNSILDTYKGIEGVGMSFSYSNKNRLDNNILDSNTLIGIRFLESNENTLFDNLLSNNNGGIALLNSANNNVVGNTISDNENGLITVSGGISFPNNTLFHNNFFDNTVQASSTAGKINDWDDGYPSGGNYWSDYTGTDADSDGIGDTSYVISTDNEDRYPLMTPWTPKPSTPLESLTVFVETIETMNLPKGIENSLTVKLENAIKQLDKGNENSVVNKLTAFINQVEALKGKKLTNEQADRLASEAQRIINLIQE